MRKALLASILVVTSALAQPSGPASDRVQAAEDVVRAMGGEAALRQTFTAMRPGLINFMIAQNHVPTGKALEVVDKVLMPALLEHTGDLMKMRAHILAKHFTVNELSDLKQFYLSPTGQKLLVIQAEMGAETMQAMQPLVRDLLARSAALQKSQSGNTGATP